MSSPHHVESKNELAARCGQTGCLFSSETSKNRETEKGVTSEDEHEVDIVVVDKNVGRSDEEKCLVDKTVASPILEGDYEEANVRIISTPLSMFHDTAIHELTFEKHIEELTRPVPAPKAPATCRRLRPTVLFLLAINF